MKKKIISLVALALVLLILISGFTAVAADINHRKPYKRSAHLITEAAAGSWNSTEGVTEIAKEALILNGNAFTADTAELKKGDTVEFICPDNVNGKYRIGFKYRVPQQYNTGLIFDITAVKTVYKCYLPKIWQDAEAVYRLDKKGDEIPSTQKGYENFVLGYAVDNSTSVKKDLMLTLNAGDSIKVQIGHTGMEIKGIYLCKEEKLPTLQDYKKEHNSAEKGKDIRIEAEKYAVKSESSIHGSCINSDKLYPYGTYSKLINSLQGAYWNLPSQKVLWEFDVEKSGMYNLGFRYSLGGEGNKPSYRTVEIDGKILYSEFENVEFKSTNSDYSFENKFLKNSKGDNLKVYLEKGKHTVALKIDVTPLEEVYNSLQQIMLEMNSLGLDLQKLTAGNVDKDKTWDLELYMPDIVPDLKNLCKRVRAEYKKLGEIGGAEAHYANNLEYACERIEKMLEEPRKIPNEIEKLNVGDDSAAKYVGTVLTKLINQPLTLDYILLSSDFEWKQENVSFFESLGNSLKRFCYSYYPKSEKENKNNGKNVKVWMNRTMQYSQVLQQLIDSDNKSLKNMNIELSVMQNQQKLVLANASGANPDVVLGVTVETPFDYAVRNALKNLCDYDDFYDYYSDRFNIENTVPVGFNRGVYGLVETIDCQMLFYRKDIFEKLGLKVPDTWDDVKKMMPVLHGNSLNFYIPLASSAGFKNYSVTSPFMYQNGGSYYADNGLSTTIGDRLSVKGFKEMTDIFSVYALQKSVPNFYNSFRYGEIPIGISGLYTYMQLMTAAPELTGLWDIKVTPGTVQPDGSIKRYQSAAATACIIFKNTKVPQESWEFLKWWMSEETQLKFAVTMESIYGMTYRWNTANIKALSQMGYSEDHIQVILEQLSHQKESLRHPANYMVEREVSNIWNSVVVDGENLQETVDKSVVLINREIKRKMQEFGFVDSEGKTIREYTTDTKNEVIKEMEKRGIKFR